jgi:hypothetical protein
MTPPRTPKPNATGGALAAEWDGGALVAEWEWPPRPWPLRHSVVWRAWSRRHPWLLGLP